jgi:hypothetical protein
LSMKKGFFFQLRIGTFQAVNNKHNRKKEDEEYAL